jgi:hypothetical protein
MPEESTTPDLVELTRRAFEGLNRGEFGLNASPDLVLDTAGYGMGTFEGREAAVGFFREWISSFEDVTIEADEIRDLGNGVVLTLYHQEARPIRGTGYLRARSASVAVWIGGLTVRNTFYPEQEIDEARAAAERLAEERGG